MHAPHSAFAQFEKDERGHTAESSVNRCCYTTVCAVEYAKVTYTLDSSILEYLFRLGFSGALSTSRVAVREFHRASSESFPPSPSL